MLRIIKQTDDMIPIYDVIFDESDNEQGLFAVSFVDAPAICVDFIAMKKQENPVKMYYSKVKHEIVSPLLIPNQLIYRCDDRGEYYIRWTKETIEQAAYNMLFNNRMNWVTEMHPMNDNPNLTYNDCLLDNVFMKRLWIIDDPKSDDAHTKYGFDLPQGTLMAHYKVNNRKLWQKIVSGELKGLSIEAVGELEYSNK